MKEAFKLFVGQIALVIIRLRMKQLLFKRQRLTDEQNYVAEKITELQKYLP